MQSVSQEYLDAFRKPVKYDRITGNIKLVDGTVIPITDSSIVQGSLQTKQRVCGSKMDIGSCNIGEISIGLFDSEAYDHDFGGALIKLRYEICTDLENDTWQSCDLKPYFVDGQQVKRVRNKLTLKGYDSAQKFDKQIPEITSADLFSTLNYVANYCGVGVATTEDEFNAYPNANITADFSSPRIQTCQDCIMWIAQTVNCCAFINHQGLLVLKPYSFFSASTSALDRQVFATERTGIEYSDSRIYLAYLASYCGGKSKNYEKITQSTGTDAPHVKEGAISLPQNPIISSLTEDEQDAVNMAYLQNRQLPARYIKSKGFVDPAIEPLDVVGFLGGNIDVDKQIIGSVTEVVWKFRGEGTITCNTFDEATDEAGSDSAAALMTLSADSSDTTITNRIAPRKTQLEKRVDELEAKGGDTAKYLKTADGAATAQTTAQGLVVVNEQGQVLFQTANTTGSGGLLQLDFTGVKINTNSPYNIVIENGRIFLQSISVQIELNPSFIRLQNGNNIDFQMYQTGFYINTPNARLRVDADGLYVNGNKIG